MDWTEAIGVIAMSTDIIKAVFPEIKIQRSLGKGGQKEAFLAIYPENREAVIKIIPPDKVNPRIMREIKILQTYNFSRVPKLYDVREYHQDEKVWLLLVEQFINGGNLGDWLKANRYFSYGHCIKIISDLLPIICEMEKQEIVHRDIKPDNIMIDGSGDFWLIDFGIARELTVESITKSDWEGPETCGYAAPEQFLNQKADIDSRTDLFSLGVVLSEGILGFHPFKHGAKSSYEVHTRIRTAAIPLVPFKEDSKRELHNFILWLLERSVVNRPRSAQEALAIFQSLYLI